MTYFMKPMSALTETGVGNRSLISMLEYCRPKDSDAEADYINRFIGPYANSDSFGNLWAVVGDNPRILFSSHTDTVHRKSGKQLITIKDGFAMSDSTCLGADDATGNWLMIEMIEAGVPGLYLFHRGEEHGGLGSQWIADNHQVLFQDFPDIQFAIALDRKGTDDVVQYQMGQRCCSTEFATDLASILGMDGGDSIGTMTDTAQYTDIITECTNISVGYYDQHSKKERQDIKFAHDLRNRLVNANWDMLKAYGYEPEYESYTMYNYTGYGMSKWEGHFPNQIDHEYENLVDFAYDRPKAIAMALYEMGIRVEDIDPEYVINHGYVTTLADDVPPVYIRSSLTDEDDQ